VPGMKGPVEGVINLRGEIIPVLRIHDVLSVPAGDPGKDGRKRRIIILDAGGGGFGFNVDEVMEVTRVSSTDVRPAPDVTGHRPGEEALLGIVTISGRMVVCIDPSKLVPGMACVQELAAKGV
jgi:purine-binding chemotaxis protein CheW